MKVTIQPVQRLSIIERQRRCPLTTKSNLDTDVDEGKSREQPHSADREDLAVEVPAREPAVFSGCAEAGLRHDHYDTCASQLPRRSETGEVLTLLTLSAEDEGKKHNIERREAHGGEVVVGPIRCRREVRCGEGRGESAET